MSLKNYELYHGAVLTQVVRNPDVSLKLIERDNEKLGWGMYRIITDKNDCILFIKSTSRKPNKGRNNIEYSNFTFSPDDIVRLNSNFDKDLLLCLVCCDNHICLLTKDDIIELKIPESKKTCGVTVSWTKGSSLTVKSKLAKLERKIARNALKNYEWE